MKRVWVILVQRNFFSRDSHETCLRLSRGSSIADLRHNTHVHQSCVLNCHTVEVVIMHETKGFSRAIRDEVIVRENNQITKRV